MQGAAQLTQRRRLATQTLPIGDPDEANLPYTRWMVVQNPLITDKGNLERKVKRTTFDRECCPFRIYTRYRSVCQESGVPLLQMRRTALVELKEMTRGVRSPPRCVPVRRILNSTVNEALMTNFSGGKLVIVLLCPCHGGMSCKISAFWARMCEVENVLPSKSHDSTSWRCVPKMTKSDDKFRWKGRRR